jgi:O-antigen/teichoic acid export membrane protein
VGSPAGELYEFERKRIVMTSLQTSALSSEKIGASPQQIDGSVSAPKISDAVLLTVSPLARRVLRALFVLAVARSLGPTRFGVYALLLSLVEMLAMISGTGFLDFLTRESAKEERRGWGLCGQLTILRFAYIVPISIAGVGILQLLGYPRVVILSSACMFLTLVPRTVSEAVQGILRGLGYYRLFLAIDLTLGLTLFAGAVFVVLRSAGLRSVILFELVSAGLAGFAALLFVVYLRPKFSAWIQWSRLIRDTAVFNFYPFVGSLYNRVDVVILSKLSGNYATGIYSTAYRAMEMFQLIPYGVLYSLLPNLTRHGLEGSERQRLERAMGLLFSSALAIVLATQVFASTAVRLFLGIPYAESAVAIKILTWGLIPMYINYSLNIALLAVGKEKVFLATSLVCLIVNFSANLFFIPRFSWPAAAVITIVTEIVLFAQNVYWLRRSIGLVLAPFGVLRISGIFLILMGVILLGDKIGFPLIVGTSCLFLFLFYLYWAGMIINLGEVWRPGHKAIV